MILGGVITFFAMAIFSAEKDDDERTLFKSKSMGYVLTMRLFCIRLKRLDTTEVNNLPNVRKMVEVINENCNN